MDVKLDKPLDDLVNEDRNLFGNRRGGRGGRGGRGVGRGFRSGGGRGLRRNPQRPRASAPFIKV